MGNPIEPARHAVAVVTNDAADLAHPATSLYVGGVGDIVITPAGAADGTSVKLEAVPVGTILPIHTKRVWATDTTATKIVALY